jgi:hypothetical protein
VRNRIRSWSVRTKILSGVIGAVMAGAVAFAATNWVVGLASNSSGQGQAAAVSNLSITAVATPAAGNLLYPGGTGDAVIKITNPNGFPVTVTAVQLPTSATYAAGYSDSALTTQVAGCSATSPSYVGWNFATSTSGSDHQLASALTVAANGTLSVTLTNDAQMGNDAPAACEGAYFKLPSLIGVTGSGGAATPTTSPATDAWTS